jgi:hypothetical protein
VLSGELQDRGGALCLLIHTLPGVQNVRLKVGGRIIRVTVRRGRGIIEGIVRLLPSLQAGRNGDNWSDVIYEMVGFKCIPVIVNVPLVSESAMHGGAAETTVDQWIDELVGRWPPRNREKTKSRMLEDEDDQANESESELEQREDEELRLDEVDHQGALDRLAVKAAIVKRRIASAPSAGGYRAALEHAVAASLVSACAPHLRCIVASWFPQVRGLKGAQ